MGRKNTLKQHQVLKNGDLSLPIITEKTHAENLDFIRYTIDWAGADAIDGEIIFEISTDDDGEVFRAAETDLVLNIDQVTGSHSIYADVDFKWCRLVFNPISLTAGTVNVYINGGTRGA